MTFSRVSVHKFLERIFTSLIGGWPMLRRFCHPSIPTAAAVPWMPSLAALALLPPPAAARHASDRGMPATRTGPSRDSGRDSRGSAREFRPRERDGAASPRSRSGDDTRGRASSLVDVGGDPFMTISHVADKAASGEGYRLTVSYSTASRSYLDVEFSNQVFDKEPETSTTPKYRKKYWGNPSPALAVRLYPLQMAKLVAVLQGRAPEAVVASRLAVATLKRGTRPETFVYSVQSRQQQRAAETDPAVSAEATVDAVNAFLLEKFLSKVLVTGFDAPRETGSASSW